MKDLSIGERQFSVNKSKIPESFGVNLDKRAEEFLKVLVEKLDTVLSLPEDAVIKQDDLFNPDTSSMFFIGRGACVIQLVDHRGNFDDSVRMLEEGEHFGEIQMIYQSHRSASVVSLNYNTLARLAFRDFRALMGEFPEYETELIKHIMVQYKEDKKIKFL